MSANLHVVLSYVPATTTLVAELYDANNVPNSSLPVPYVINGTYTFTINNTPLTVIVGGDRVEVSITAPVCTDRYAVDVVYTANTIPQPNTFANVVIGNGYIFGDYLVVSTIPGGAVVTLAPPAGVTPSSIVYARNYQVMDPSPVSPFVAPGNGVYEVEFVDLVANLAYRSSVEVTQSTAANYVTMVGDDGRDYGLFGTPPSISELAFSGVGGREPYRYRVYVNGILYSDNPFIVISRLATGDRITVQVIDCCDLVSTATTTVLGCSILTARSRVANLSAPVASSRRTVSKPRSQRRGCGCHA